MLIPSQPVLLLYQDYVIYFWSLSQLLTFAFSTLTSNIHLTILISARRSATTFSFLTGQVSFSCNILFRTQLPYFLPLIIINVSLLVSNGINCLNLFHPIRSRWRKQIKDDWHHVHCRRVQSLSHGYATSILQSRMCDKRYIVLSNLLSKKQKKLAPSLTGDFNPKSSHWNNGKMKIAHNSAYVQIETFHFTFTEQAVIVYFNHAKQVHTRQQCYRLQTENDVMVSSV